MINPWRCKFCEKYIAKYKRKYRCKPSDKVFIAVNKYHPTSVSHEDGVSYPIEKNEIPNPVVGNIVTNSAGDFDSHSEITNNTKDYDVVENDLGNRIQNHDTNYESNSDISDDNNDDDDDYEASWQKYLKNSTFYEPTSMKIEPGEVVDKDQEDQEIEPGEVVYGDPMIVEEDLLNNISETENWQQRSKSSRIQIDDPIIIQSKFLPNYEDQVIKAKLNVGADNSGIDHNPQIIIHKTDKIQKITSKREEEDDSEDHRINDSMENNGNKSFKCEHCDKMFTANRNLKRHIYIVHEGHKDFQCAVCYQFFGFKQILERHMEKMHNIETSKNDTNIQFENDPEEDFSAENEIDYDLMDNSNEVIETLDDFTEKSFKNEAMDMLEENSIKIEFIDENTQMDDQISLSPPPPPKTNYDVEIYHNIEFKKSKKSWQYGSSHDCEHCGKSFPQSGTLRRHINDVHEGIRNYKCHLCDQKFAQKSSLSGHLLTIHKIKPENKTIYKCSHCEKEFEKLSKLQTHEAVHLKPAREPTDIKCEICSKTFSDKANLKKHVQSIHEGLKKYSCDICSEKFKQLIAMQRHKKRYHDIEIERKTYKPRMDLEPRLDCPTCGKEFKRFSIVKMHIKNYHSQEIHQCNICEEKFLLKEDLQSHYQMVHEGIEPPPDYRSHNCDICGRPFADYSNYRRHVSNSYCNDSKNMVKL